MKKLAMLGIIGGAAILTAAPLSLQWSQKNVVLSLDSAKAGTATSAGVSRRVHRKAYRRAAYGTAAAGSGGYGYSSLANCGGEYLAYGTSYVAPCGQYSSSYAIAEERLKTGYSVPPFVETLAPLRSRSCIIDGEAVACDDNGVASFDLVRHHCANDMCFYALST